MRTLHVSAGGSNTRIQSFLTQKFGHLPKHLLPVPCKEGTLLGHLLSQGGRFFARTTVWTSQANILSFVGIVGKYPRVSYTVDQHMTGPLGPMVRDMLESKTRAYGCAGDYYCDFSWEDMEKFHNSHGLPATILIAKSAPFPDAATFTRCGSGKITAWERKRRSEPADLINIGCYIFDYTPRMAELLGQVITYHKEDAIFEKLIEEGLLAGYVPECMGFNVNTQETYEQLLAHLPR